MIKHILFSSAVIICSLSAVAQNVGIGTSTPATKLHIDAGALGIGRQDGLDETPYLQLGLNDGYYQYLTNNAQYNSTTDVWNYVNTGGYSGLASKIEQYSGYIKFSTAGGGANPINWNDRLYIGNDGNVGVGTNSPAYKLDVSGDIYADGGWFRVSGNQGLYWQTHGSGFNMSDASWIRGYGSAGLWMNSATIGTNGSFSSGFGGAAGPAGGAAFSGNVGIGTTTPAGKLDVVGDIYGVNFYSFQGGNEAVNDWEVVNIGGPALNSATDDSWYVVNPGTNWGSGILSKRRFNRTPGLTLEYEAYMVSGEIYMVGFAGGNLTNPTHGGTPTNYIYHANQAGVLQIYENGAYQNQLVVNTNDAWYRFKTVLKAQGADYYVFLNNTWTLIASTANNGQKYVRVAVDGHTGAIRFRNMRVYQANSDNNLTTGNGKPIIMKRIYDTSNWYNASGVADNGGNARYKYIATGISAATHDCAISGYSGFWDIQENDARRRVFWIYETGGLWYIFLAPGINSASPATGVAFDVVCYRKDMVDWQGSPRTDTPFYGGQW